MGTFEGFLGMLGTISDPRRGEGKVYQLPYVLLFSILAVVTGANSYRGITTFIRVHRAALNQAFGINWKRAPAHTSIRYAMQGLDPADVETVFREHASKLDNSGASANTRRLAIDGKVLKGSFDAMTDLKAKQILSAFATDTHLVLAHIEIDEKSNEIPAAQTLLREIDAAGRIVTLDAMHCQKKTFEAAAAARAHLVVQLKDNQPNLRIKVDETCRNTKPLSFTQTFDRKTHNRNETRTLAVYDASPAVAKTEWQPHVAAIIQIERIVHTFQPAKGFWKTSTETALYLSSHAIEAKPAASIVRGHLGIENKSHYSRDVTFREDASRIRCNPGIFARLRSFAYNIIQANRCDTIPQDPQQSPHF